MTKVQKSFHHGVNHVSQQPSLSIMASTKYHSITDNNDTKGNLTNYSHWRRKRTLVPNTNSCDQLVLNNEKHQPLRGRIKITPASQWIVSLLMILLVLLHMPNISSPHNEAGIMVEAAINNPPMDSILDGNPETASTLDTSNDIVPPDYTLGVFYSSPQATLNNHTYCVTPETPCNLTYLLSLGAEFDQVVVHMVPNVSQSTPLLEWEGHYYTTIQNLSLIVDPSSHLTFSPNFSIHLSAVYALTMQNFYFPNGLGTPFNGAATVFLIYPPSETLPNPTFRFSNLTITGSSNQYPFVTSSVQYFTLFELDNVNVDYSAAQHEPDSSSNDEKNAFIWITHSVGDYREVRISNCHITESSHYILSMPQFKHLHDLTITNSTLRSDNSLMSLTSDDSIDRITLTDSNFHSKQLNIHARARTMISTDIQRCLFDGSHGGFRIYTITLREGIHVSDSQFINHVRPALDIRYLASDRTGIAVDHLRANFTNLTFDLVSDKASQCFFVQFISQLARGIIHVSDVDCNASNLLNVPHIELHMNRVHLHDYWYLETPALTVASQTGQVYIDECIFERIPKGISIEISNYAGTEVVVTRSRFEHLSVVAPADSAPLSRFLDQLGGALFLSAGQVNVTHCTFSNITFTSKAYATENVRNGRIGIVAINIVHPVGAFISNNHFEDCFADVGSGVLVWSDVISNPHPLTICHNTFINNEASIGSAVAVFNNLVLDGLYITDNYFYRNNAVMMGVIYLRTFITTKDVVIARNSFVENLSNSSLSSVLDFSSGHIVDLRVESNRFHLNRVHNEIHATVSTIDGVFYNLSFAGVQPVTQETLDFIRVSADEVYDFSVSHVYLEHDTKQLMSLQAGSQCTNIDIHDAFVLNRVYQQDPQFLNIRCSILRNMHMMNVKAFGSVTLEQTQAVSPNRNILIENVSLRGRLDSSSNLLRLNFVHVCIKNSRFDEVSGLKGAMIFSLHSTLRIENSHFETGRASAGGCIYARDGSLRLVSSSLSDCHAENGGGIFGENLSSFSIVNTSMSSMHSDFNGGCVHLRNTAGPVYINSSHFSRSSALQEGGCVYASRFHSLHVHDSSFDRCQSQLVGGGMLIDSGRENGRSSTGMILPSRNEESSSVSSSVDSSPPNNLTVAFTGLVSFKECTASTAGGGLWVEYYYPQVKNALQNKILQFSDCYGKFEDNLASTPEKIVMNSEWTEKEVSAAFVLYKVNSVYSVASVHTMYGPLKSIQNGGMYILNLQNNNTRPQFCFNDLPKNLQKNNYCFTYEYQYGLQSQHLEYDLIFDETFRLGHRPLRKRSQLFVASLFSIYFLIALVVLIIATTICFILLCASFLIGISVYVLVKTKAKADTADMELSLLKNRFDQEHLLDADINRAKLKLRQDLFEIKFSDVKLLEKIGSGGSGAVVMKGIWKGEQVALKVFKTSFMTDDVFLHEFENEAELLASLHHPNIVRFYGALLDPPRCGIVTEYHPSSAEKLIQSGKSKELSWVQKLTLLTEVATAMEFLVECQVWHRDLKWGNVLLSNTGKARLTDFGLSRTVNDAANAGGMTTRIGTNYLMSPEMVRGLEYDWKCDVFSLGIMMWELLADQMQPFGNAPGIEYNIATDPNYRPDLQSISITSDKAWYVVLMKRCWSHDPQKRPSFSEIRETLQDEIDNAGGELAECSMRCTQGGDILIGKEQIVTYEEGSGGTNNDGAQEKEEFTLDQVDALLEEEHHKTNGERTEEVSIGGSVDEEDEDYDMMSDSRTS